ncbi:MAG: type IV pilus secretin PilQ [Candidatus Aminicenantia bacterium]
MRKKIVFFVMLLFISLLIQGDQKEEVSINKVFFDNQGDKTVFVFKTSSFVPLPTIYNDPSDLLLVKMELNQANLKNIPKEYSVNSFAVKKLVLQEREKGVLANFFLEKPVPYRVYSDKDGVFVNFYNPESIPNTKTQTAPQSSNPKPDFRDKVEEKPFAPQVRDLKINPFETGVEILVIGNNLNKFEDFTLQNPNRIVVDLLDAKNICAKAIFQVKDSQILKSIRVAQNRTSPYVTRVVLDLIGKTPEYNVKSVADGILITLLTQKTVKAKEKVTTEEPKKEEKPASPVPAKLEPESKEVKETAPKAPQKLEQEKPKEQKPEEKPKEEPKQIEKEPYLPKVITEERKVYKGEKYTFRFKDADIRDFLKFVATIANINIIIDPGVTGKVTCDLVQIPWDQALELILKTNGLGYVMEENVMRIAKIETLTKEQEAARKLKEAQQLAGELKVITRTLSYAKAKAVQPILAKQLSQRGEIIIDDRTNTLIISDIPDKVGVIDKLIETLDAAIPQVSIEARIVEINTNYTKNLGIQWGVFAAADAAYGNQTSLKFPNSIIIDGSAIKEGGLQNNPLDGYAVNLPAPAFSSGLGISLGNVVDTFRLDIALTALETSGQGKILSAPKISAQNNETAEILQGRQIPVQTVANNTVTTRYVNAALELHVTPQITAEGTIIMTIEIRNDAADFANLVQGIPPIITQSAKTTVLVKDGGTAVIGGIYRIEDTITRSSVPGLSNIPLIGNIFKGFSKNVLNKELLIFITPRIIKS